MGVQSSTSGNRPEALLNAQPLLQLDKDDLVYDATEFTIPPSTCLQTDSGEYSNTDEIYVPHMISQRLNISHAPLLIEGLEQIQGTDATYTSNGSMPLVDGDNDNLVSECESENDILAGHQVCFGVVRCETFLITIY